MADLEGARLWLIADRAIPALSYVRQALEERGADVDLLDLSAVVERIVRDRGESMLETLRDVFRRAADAGDDQPDELEQALSEGPPHLIVVAGPRYLRGLDLVARMAGPQAVKVALLVDFNLGGAWIKSSVGAFVVPHEKLVRPLLDSGVEESRIFVAGPPIDPRFENVADRAELDAAFHLDRSLGPVVLVFGEYFEASELDKLLFQLSLVDGAPQLVFYAGSDPTRAEALRRAARKHGVQARMFGDVPNLQDFVAVADLVVSHAKDPGLLGPLALDRPLIVVGDPGAATAQTDFLVSEGVAWHSGDLLRLGADVELALRPDKLKRMSEASCRVGRGSGAREVADALASIYLAREELALGTAPPAEPSGEQGAPSAGPFELIGAPAPTAGTHDRTSRPPREHVPRSGLSAADAKDELASLIMAERDAEKRLTDARKDQEQWRNRLELAREWNEAELAAEAEKVLKKHLEDAERFAEELERVRAQKDKLKSRVRGGEPAGPTPRTADSTSPAEPDAVSSQMDKRFRTIEVERDLSDLKERLRREMDE